MSERLSPIQEPNIDKSAEIREEKKEGILGGIKFTKIQHPDGNIEYKSSESGRKLVVLDTSSEFEPDENASYEVEIIHDTKPGVPDKGKYLVRIISEDGVPVEARVAEKNKPIASVEIDTEAGKVYILDSEMSINPEGGKMVPRPEKFRYFTLDEETLGVLEKIANGVERREPTLLEGETSTSKTSSIEFAAMITGNDVMRLNLNGQTDTSELIGKFIPNDGQLQMRFEDSLRNPHLLSELSRRILEDANTEGRALTLVESQKIAQSEGMKVPDWRWQDGLDVQAKREGKWLILDEINLAEPQILERLNSQLEKHPSITLSENGGKTIRELSGEEMEQYKAGKLPELEPLHPNFRIFATMNPAEYSGRQPMSPAYKDRWTNYKSVQPPTEKSYSAMMRKMVYGEQPEITVRGVKYEGEIATAHLKNLGEIPNFGGFMVKMAKFQITLEGLARKREIGKNKKEKYIFTRRGLIEFMEYLETKTIIDRKTKETKTIQNAPKEIILRGIQNYYLDKISDKDDLKKVMDQLDAIGISERNWTNKFEETPSKKKLKKGGVAGVTPKAGAEGKEVKNELKVGDTVRRIGRELPFGKIIEIKDKTVIVSLPPDDKPVEINKVGIEKVEEGGEKKEVFGRDPEPFLREVFKAEGWMDKWDNWGMTLSRDEKTVYVARKLLEAKFIDKRKMVSMEDYGGYLVSIPKLLEKIKGKKVISIDSGGEWFLEVVGGGEEEKGEEAHDPDLDLLDDVDEKIVAPDSDVDLLDDDEGEGGEKKEAEPVGHDPEPFLREVFREKKDLHMWDIGWTAISDDGKYIDMGDKLTLYAEKFIDKKEKVSFVSKKDVANLWGIPALLEKIKGKKVISIDNGGKWFLEVVG